MRHTYIELCAFLPFPPHFFMEEISQAKAEMEKRTAAQDIEREEQHERTGTLWTATAHIVTAVIGSGVLALPWSVAQLGWVAGPLALAGFACVTYYTSTLLASSYRSPDPIAGARNRTYMDAVRSYLSPGEVFMCGVAQYVNLWGTMVGYTITATISMIAIRRLDCVHRSGRGADCDASGSGTVLMLVFSTVQVVLSQLPSLENITWLSVVAAVMSFTYSFIGLGLSVAVWASHGDTRGGLAGATAVSSSKKAWNMLLAVGNIAFAYTFAEVLIEIQDTLRSPPPEKRTMKKAAMYGIGATTVFYLSVGCAGYAAFGSDAPGNILTGSGFSGPYWVVDVANICLIIHLIGAYQVYAQPIFAKVERWAASRWPEAKFINSVCTFSVPFVHQSAVKIAPSKLVLRTAIVMATTLVAMLVPFFNAVLGLLGAFSFWPLTVYFPVSMHIAQAKIGKAMPKWFLLQGLSMFCLLISVAVGIGSVTDIVSSLKVSTPFKTMG